MNLTSAFSLLTLATLAAACSAPLETERAQASKTTSAIVNGTLSPEEEDYVVDLVVPGGGACTGTLIAPNVVVTALHCVSDFNFSAPFTCSPEGVLVPHAAGAGQVGDLVDPKRVEVRVGGASSMEAPDAHGIKIFGSGSFNICSNDIAAVVIDTELSPPPQRVRLGNRTPRNEYTTLIGYGQDENGFVRIRNRRSGLRVLGVGAMGQYEQQGVAAPRTFVVGEGPCHGDSGGPAFSEVTGALTGVFSLVSATRCDGAGLRNVCTQVGAFEKLLTEAAEYAGAELLLEPRDPEPTAGAGGEPSVGSGGSLTTGGKDSGSGGADGLGGSEPVTTSSGGMDTGDGSGSRRDSACSVSFGQIAANSSPAWLASLSVLALALFRRRPR